MLDSVTKIITEILILLWKALRLVFWKWLRPLVGRLLFFAAVVVGLLILVTLVMC